MWAAAHMWGPALAGPVLPLFDHVVDDVRGGGRVGRSLVGSPEVFAEIRQAAFDDLEIASADRGVTRRRRAGEQKRRLADVHPDRATLDRDVELPANVHAGVGELARRSKPGRC